jgi:hypothetical protein
VLPSAGGHSDTITLKKRRKFLSPEQQLTGIFTEKLDEGVLQGLTSCMYAQVSKQWQLKNKNHLALFPSSLE